MPRHHSPPLRKAVIDTGPLLTTLTLVYIQQSPQHRELLRHKHKLPSYITDPTSERNFLQFISGITQPLITSHVLGEIRSRSRVPEEIHREFWLSAMKFLSEINLNEQLILLSDLYRNDRYRMLVSILGPTDAGVIALAEKEECVLLTDDSRLFHWSEIADVRLIKNEL